MSAQAKAALEEAGKTSSLIPEFYIDIFARIVPGGLIIFLWFPGLIFTNSARNISQSTNAFTAIYSTTNVVNHQIVTIKGMIPVGDVTNAFSIQLSLTNGPATTNISELVLGEGKEIGNPEWTGDKKEIPDAFRYIGVFFIAWLLGAACEKFSYAIWDFLFNKIILEPKLKEVSKGNLKVANSTVLRWHKKITRKPASATNLMDYEPFERRLYLRAMSEMVMFRSIFIILFLKPLFFIFKWPVPIARASSYWALSIIGCVIYYHIWLSVRHYPKSKAPAKIKDERKWTIMLR